LRLLGAPAVVRADGRSTRLEKRAAGLLALVALQPGSSRAQAAAMLWPDSDDPRRALRQQLLRFRRSFGVELIEGEDMLRLSPSLRVDALDGGVGELLGTLSFEDWDDFADWLAAERESRRGGTTAQLSQKLAAAQAQGDLDAALQAAQELLRADFESEVHHRNLMRLHYLRGDVAQAQAVYERLKQHLHTRYGVTPSQETEQIARASQQAVAAQGASVSRLPAVPVTVLRPPRLIGRQADLLQVRAAWAQSCAVLILGEPGLGKTRLLDEAIVGRRALVAQGRPGDSGVPYATLARVLRSLINHFHLVLDDAQRLNLARLLPELAPGAVLPAEAPGLALRQAVEAAFASAHQDGAPLEVMVIDDLHFADDASIEMLQSLISALHRQLHFALAQRPGEGSTAAGLLRAQLEEARFMKPLILAPLREDEVAELIDSIEIEDLDAQALAAPLTRHTGGNPLFALETVKQGLATGQLRAGQLPQPDAVGTLIERRLKQLPEKAIALARVAAIAGPDFSIALAEHALGERALALADVWNSLQDAQVLRDTGFAHDLVADAVLRSVPAPIARHLHGNLAAWLEQREGEPARIAAHWLAAGDAPRALPWLHRAADRALQALRPRESVEFLERALELEVQLAPKDTAFATLSQIVDLRVHVDLSENLLEAIERLDTLATTPAQRIQALHARAEFAMHRSQGLQEGRDAAAHAVQLALATEDRAKEIELRATLAALEMMTGHAEEALAQVDAFLPGARTWPDTETRANLLGYAAYVLTRTPRAAEGAALFDESARQAIDIPRVRLVALANAAHARLQLNDPQAALDCLAQSDALRAAHDDLRGSGHSNAWMRASALRLLGRYGEALALLDAAAEEMRSAAPGKLTSVLADRAMLWLELGQINRAQQDRTRALEARTSAQGDVALHLLDLRLHAQRLGPAPAALQRTAPHFARLRIALAGNVLQDDASALAALQDTLQQSRSCAYHGLEAAALARMAQRHQAMGSLDAARDCAAQAIARCPQLNTEDLSWPEIILCAAPALEAAGDRARARALLDEGAAWIERVRVALPAAHQSSFLTQNASARRLLTSAVRARRS
jgi:DNA-binding SARP family transcriptional activator